MNAKRSSKKHEADLLGRLESADDGWRVVGDMNFVSVPVLLSQGRNLLDFSSELRIDLQEVDHADSAGLALMLEWLDFSRSGGGRISYRNVPESLTNIARVSNMPDLLPIEK